jgi:iron complex outermembrane recepter protein
MLLCARSQAQDTSMVHEFEEVQVTGFKEESKINTSVQVVSLSRDEMRSLGSYNIADGLSQLAGISQLGTGLAISKPVIRGLYGNRILTLLSGLRFDNQQWQDEHGLGLSDIGIDRVEVIKGPLAVLYGTDAVGGVINIIEEQKAPDNQLLLDYNLRLNSNTLGGITDIGLKGHRHDSWWRVRVGGEAHADYADGAGTRVLNSRFNGMYTKASYGMRKKHWATDNNYSFSLNNYGFITNDIYTFIQPDARYSYSLSTPHHTVMLHILSSQNTITLPHSLLKLNIGLQSNQRKEDEGGGSISLNMLLTTAQYNLQWSRPLGKHIELIISQLMAYENNTNLGKRVIIPDAHTLETSLSTFVKWRIPHAIVELGAGLNDKYIQAVLTPQVNGAGHIIQPFGQNRIAANGVLGITINPNNYCNIKLHTATGLRAPNLAELSSNGLHEGIFTYEVGDPKLHNEQNISTDMSISYGSRYARVSLAGFYNQFFGYVYLQRSDSSYLPGFPTYLYKQQDAWIAGGELEYEITPQGLVKGLVWSQQFSALTGMKQAGGYLPFLAAPKLNSTIKYGHTISKRVTSLYATVGFDYVFTQSRPAAGETTTPAYHLLNTSIGMDIAIAQGSIRISILCNNLLGTQYYDHLSRLKTYTDYRSLPHIYNIGRNIMLNLSIPIHLNNRKH